MLACTSRVVPQWEDVLVSLPVGATPVGTAADEDGEVYAFFQYEVGEKRMVEFKLRRTPDNIDVIFIATHVGSGISNGQPFHVWLLPAR